MAVTVMKTTFEILKNKTPKIIRMRDFKKFCDDKFRQNLLCELQNLLCDCNGLEKFSADLHFRKRLLK